MSDVTKAKRPRCDSQICGDKDSTKQGSVLEMPFKDGDG